MSVFLEEVISEIRERHGNRMHEAALVLPSRRAIRFTRRFLSQTASKPEWAPRLLTLPQLQSEISGLQAAESLDQLIHLQDSYYKVFKTVPALDEFLDLGRSIITDFDEVCNYDVQPDKLFRNLREAKELDNWMLEEWSFDAANAEELSEGQKQFNIFWQQLGKLFTEYNRKMRDMGIGYPGLIALEAARKAEDYCAKENSPFVHFAGFHALNQSESSLIDTLFKADKAQVHWDVDEFYTSANREHEAGHFIRKVGKWSFAKDLTKHNMLSNPPKIGIHETSGNVAQTRLASQLLEEIPHDSQTAIVLCDEGLLFPFLHSIGDKEYILNLTMGLSLDILPFSSWLNTFTNTLHHRERTGRLETDRVYQLLGQEIVKPIISDEQKWRKLRKSWITKNKVYADDEVQKQLIECLEEEGEKFTTLIFSHDITGYELLERIAEFTESLADLWYRKSPEAIETSELYRWLQQLNRLKDLFQHYPERLNRRAVEKLLTHAGQSGQVDFIGEPLQGMQVMGLLETRALDFKRLIFVGVNEGIIPRSGRNQSFIPYDIRRSFGMPTHKEREALFAYHFYRLFHRAEEVEIIYQSADGGDSESLRSRYVDQLIREFSGVKPPLIHSPRPSTIPGDAEVQKTPAIIERIYEYLEKGLSPSALTTYLRSPLDFYERFIARVPEPELLSGEIDASNLGSAIHDGLEKALKDKGPLSAQDIKNAIPVAQEEFRRVLREQFPGEAIERGSNHISVGMGMTMIERWLNTEAALTEETGQPLTVRKCEKKAKAQWKLSNGKQVVLKGYLDRLDDTEYGLRVLDYKTGRVDERSLELKSIEEVYEKRGDKVRDKAIQLLCYALMTVDDEQSIPATVVIANLSNPNKGMMPLSIANNTGLNKDIIQRFRELTTQLIENELLNPEVPFSDEPELEPEGVN